jgi:putative tryptophan/tyrosine transport system substrate-binding protein
MFHTMISRSRTHRIWMALTWLMVIALLLNGCGSAKPKVYHVGILDGFSFFNPAVTGFKAEMTKLGYIEGKNIIYDVQSTDIDVTAYTNAVKKFVEEKVDLIFVYPTEASMIAKEGTQGTNIPVVFTLAFTDVKGVNLIDSIQAPGGNITGVRYPTADIASKRMQILLDMAPNAKRVLVPYLKDYPNVPGQLDALRPLAQARGVTLIELPVASPPELQAAIDQVAALSDPGFDAVLQINEAVSSTPAFYDILAKFCYERKIPIGGALMDPDGNGSLFGLTPQADVAGQQSAILADKIFKGTPAGTIPVLTSEGYFQINLKAAQALGVTVPEGLIKQAENVIH